MFGDDDTPHEPDEPDPEADLPDYEAELTDVPEAPSVPDPTENLPDDAPRYVKRYFWRTVLVVDYAIAAVAIGPMLAYFEGDLRLGGALAATGVLAFAYAYVLYLRFRAISEAKDDGDDEGVAPAADGGEASPGDPGAEE